MNRSLNAGTGADGAAKSPVRLANSVVPEMRETLRLGTPLALAEIGWMSTYLVDAYMVGRLPHGAEAIAASSLGNTIFYAIVFFGIGLLYGLDTLVSQAFGRSDHEGALRCLMQSMWLVMLWTPATFLLLLATGPLLRWDGIEPALAASTIHYMTALEWSTVPLLLYMALRRYLQAIDRTMAIMVSLLTANVVNFVADWALLFGHLGFRAYGLAGSGWATVIVRCYMLALLVGAFVWHLRRDRLRMRAQDLIPSSEPLRALVRLGWAPAIQTMADLGVSTVQTLICGRLGAVALAVNQVVLDVSAFVYMVPLGLQSATAIRVGQSVGAEHRRGVSLTTRVGSWLSIGFAGSAAMLFLARPRWLASIYTVDPVVVSTSVGIFAIAATYQAFDAWESSLAGSLRGLGDTQTSMYAGVFWSWIVGVPLTWGLTLHTQLGLHGLWIGRALPSILTAITVAVVWRSRFRRLYPPAPKSRRRVMAPRTGSPTLPGSAGALG